MICAPARVRWGFRWKEGQSGRAAGARLRELARSAGIPAGTVLARAKRDGWKQQVAEAQLIKRPPSVPGAKTRSTFDEVTPFESVVFDSLLV
jgi:hypothetical protein